MFLQGVLYIHSVSKQIIFLNKTFRDTEVLKLKKWSLNILFIKTEYLNGESLISNGIYGDTGLGSRAICGQPPFVTSTFLEVS